MSFFFAAVAQLEPALHPVFAERVARSWVDPGPGDVDRAVRQALVGLWVPPAIEELRAASRWDRDTPPKHAG